MQSCFSKVLLFGEHTVVNGASAIAIPFPHFYGSWKFNNSDIDRNLSSFADYIDHHDYLFQKIAIDKFFADLDRGLVFDSNIPMGYGLGSSGALVAAVYKRYGLDIEDINHRELNQHLADLESHFHGRSSGFDPMVCYLNQAVISKNGGFIAIEKIELPKEEYQLFLMNTNVSRSTGPLVEKFQTFYEAVENRRRINEEYIPIVNQAIDSLLKSDNELLYSSLEALSGYQYAYLNFLIDEGSKAIWKEGLASDYFKIKICGAGGGGYLLGITKSMNQLLTDYPTRDIIPIK